MVLTIHFVTKSVFFYAVKYFKSSLDSHSVFDFLVDLNESLKFHHFLGFFEAQNVNKIWFTKRKRKEFEVLEQNPKTIGNKYISVRPYFFGQKLAIL
jgi:hypothetical protein